MFNGLGGDAMTRNAEYLLHHVTYVPVTFEVISTNGLGEDAFTRKYII